LLYAIHSPFCWRILKNTIIRKTRTLEFIHEQRFVERKNEVRKLESEKTRVYAQKPRLKMQFKNSICGCELNTDRGGKTMKEKNGDRVRETKEAEREKKTETDRDRQMAIMQTDWRDRQRQREKDGKTETETGRKVSCQQK
jgi:hypothetical protein